MHRFDPFVLLLGRTCLVIIFLLSGIYKSLFHWTGSLELMASKGMSMVSVFLIAAVLIEIICSIMIILGFKTRWAAAILFLYLIPVTYFLHDFWNSDPTTKPIQIIMFLKNVAICGGFLYVWVFGAGKFSIDFWLRNDKKGRL